MSMSAFIAVLAQIWDVIMGLLYQIADLYITYPFLTAAISLFVFRKVIDLFKYIVY